MASNESNVNRFLGDGALQIVGGSGMLGGDDQRNLEIALAPALAPQDPLEREAFLRKLRERLTIERVIELMLGSAFGHVLEHHCMTSFSLNLCPQTLLEAFSFVKARKSINKVFVRVSAAYAKAEPEEITPEVVLRCRVIGMSLETLTLPEKPNKCTACAFTSRTSTVAAARSISYIFLKYIQDGNTRRSGQIVSDKGTCTVEFIPRLGGYALVAPISMVGHDVASGVVGFTTPFKFDEIAGTINKLVATLKPKKSAHWNKLLMLFLDLVTEPIDVTSGTVRTIYKSDMTPDAFYIFSMYPEPSSQF